jgi:serine/threonine-protein kinase SRPK3
VPTSNIPKLALTVEQGYGYFPARPGLTLKDGRYEVSRMLGISQLSSVFLVRDLGADGHNHNYALKILTASATQHNRDGHYQELQALQAISEAVKSTNALHCLPELVDHFETTGPHGDHLCFVLRLRSTDVSSFRRSAPSRTLLLRDVKKVVLHTVYALDIIHKLGMIHTNVKPTGIVIFPGVEDTVTPIIEGEIEMDGTTYPIMKIQPLPHTFKWDDKDSEVASRMFCLNDVGTSVRADRENDYQLGTPYALRAPEVILRAGYDSKIDIWAIGCLAFELLTGHWAFSPEAGTTWSIKDDHLARMLELTGETFDASMLARSQLRDEFFDRDGNLKNIPPLDVLGIQQAISIHVALPPEDSKAAAEFIAACLHLDSSRRPSANDLVHHPWLEGGIV